MNSLYKKNFRLSVTSGGGGSVFSGAAAVPGSTGPTLCHKKRHCFGLL